MLKSGGVKIIEGTTFAQKKQYRLIMCSTEAQEKGEKAWLTIV